MDLFVVPTISFRLLYGLLIMGHGRRQILWFGVTTHPTAEWLANQLIEACGWEQIPRYLIRDRDRAYGEIFVRRVRSIGIRDRPTSFRSPWQNGYAERLIGSIGRECIDHVVVFGERHLRLASHPDLIVSGSGTLALVLKSLTATIPIITASGDLVVVGLATSLGRPGGNITGVSVDPGFEVWSKRLQLLSETASNRLTNVRVLAAATLQWWDAAGGAVRETARRSGVAITVAFFGDGIIDHAAYERMFDAIEKDRVDGLMVGDAA